jgi:hypothetical protein
VDQKLPRRLSALLVLSVLNNFVEGAEVSQK